MQEEIGDNSWLGPYHGVKSNTPTTRICTHCGREASSMYVYDNGEAYYCSEECLFSHFTAKEWDEYIERANSVECCEPGLAYVMDFSERKW